MRAGGLGWYSGNDLRSRIKSNGRSDGYGFTNIEDSLDSGCDFAVKTPS